MMERFDGKGFWPKRNELKVEMSFERMIMR